MPLTAFFAAVLLVQLGYLVALRTGFRRARARAPHPEEEQHVGLPPVSVIVAARDEERTLPDLLDALARQTHPDYEVLVIDDASTDGTAALVHTWQKSHPEVRLVSVEAPLEPRKKHALTLGIQAARHEYLAFTDADCRPPLRWLEQGVRAMDVASRTRSEEGPADVLLVGYSPYRSEASLINLFSRYETLVTGYLTAAAIGFDRPYMAVGRNLFHSKKVFAKTGGFAETMQSLSGDDDLFLQQVAARGTARIIHLFGPETYVSTLAPPTWRSWIRQKIRHTSAGRFYPASVQRHLALYHGTSTLLWIAPLVVGWWGLLMLVSRMVLHAGILHEGARVLNERRLLRAHPLLEFLYLLYNAVLAPVGILKPPSRW